MSPQEETLDFMLLAPKFPQQLLKCKWVSEDRVEWLYVKI